MRRRKDATAHEADDRTRQSGFVAVWMAMVLFVLIGVAAFAVDLVHAYLVGQEVQNAADAAATAGSAQIPNDIPCAVGGHARTTAASLAQKNLSDAQLTVPPGDIDARCTGPNEMTVDVKAHIDTWFARAIGFSKLTVHRQAVAQFDPVLAMGSPANNLGDVPGDSCTDLGFGLGGTPCASIPLNATQNLFAQIQGPQTDKLAGNAYSTTYCNDSSAPFPSTDVVPDGCTSTGTNGNAEFDTNTGGDETFYVQNDPSNLGGPLTIAVYDAGFVDTGGFCDAATHAITGGLTYPLRYFDNSPYCAGDRRQKGVDPAGTNAMDTEFEVLDPDGASICDTGTIAGQEPPNGSPLTAESQWFQQWKVICTIPITSTTQNTYRIRVHSATGQGTNNFSLLALHNTGSAPPLNLAIATHEKLPLFASKPNGTPGEFYLARVPGSSQTRTLTLDFFDLGDSVQPLGPTCVGGVPKPPGGCPSTGTITIHPDGDPTPFSTCTITSPVGGNQSDAPNTGPPWGGQSAFPSSCQFPYDRTTWNGQWVTIKVTIPPAPSYGCTNFSDFQQCWIKINIAPNIGAAPLSDATTWNARIGGAPVRLTG